METLLVIEPSETQPRNSEGDIVPLKDGSLCLIYTRFTGGTGDHSGADLAMRRSSDGGRTWSDDKIVVPNDAGRNVMSVSLNRLQSGAIAMFYLRKESLTDCRPMMRISTDEAVTWSDPTACITDEIGYYVLNNARARQLQNGRIVLPLALHSTPETPDPGYQGIILCYLSDDEGKTWRRSQDSFKVFEPNGERVTAQEPGVVELSDGRLLMYMRTSAGSQYVCHSADDGETWTTPRPSSLESPLSPATIERMPGSGDLICVWNDHSGLYPYRHRTPLTVAISKDDGVTWGPSRVIERNYLGHYCYTSITFHEDRAFLSYCAGDHRVGGLNRLKLVAIRKDALAGDAPLLAPPRALLAECLDYGRSFINTKASWNSPRFWVESRLLISDPASGKTVEYLQAGSCKSERTFSGRDLFLEDNYDFLPVFSASECIIFRRHSRVTPGYREIKPIEKAWDGAAPQLRKFQGRVLNGPREVFEAMETGKTIVGQTEIRDAKSGRTAVIEYPVKTINWERDKIIWQVDTGPVLLPDLSVPAEEWSKTIRLAYIAFNAPDWVDFVVEEPTPLDPEVKSGQKIMHYSALEHWAARNVLLAFDE